MVEYFPYKEEVSGSNPLSSTKKENVVCLSGQKESADNRCSKEPVGSNPTITTKFILLSNMWSLFVWLKPRR
jgi:hypothetical protein